MFQQVCFEFGVPVLTGFDQQLPLLARTELAEVPERGDNCPMI
jgi:hypothetical protein